MVSVTTTNESSNSKSRKNEGQSPYDHEGPEAHARSPSSSLPPFLPPSLPPSLFISTYHTHPSIKSCWKPRSVASHQTGSLSVVSSLPVTDGCNYIYLFIYLFFFFHPMSSLPFSLIIFCFIYFFRFW